MKVGIMTFHWATNYGAVLQSFALQEHIKKMGHEVEIIDYKPLRLAFLRFVVNTKRLSSADIIREFAINSFRKQYLNVSSKRFRNSKDLHKFNMNYNAYICGSDQIWNEWFTLKAEGGPTLSYFIDFIKDNRPKIAYAASFGADEISEEMIELITPELRKFKNISVREMTGVIILEKIGFSSTLVLDPTMLVKSSVFEKLIEGKEMKIRYNCFSYLININQLTARKICNYIYKNYFKKDVDNRYTNQPIGVLEWLFCIQKAQLVITNSFHGTIFAVIFHRPFVVIPVEGSKMNDRIVTLLSLIGLKNRILNTYDETKIDSLMKESINWKSVEEYISILRGLSTEFLIKNLNEACVNKIT